MIWNDTIESANGYWLGFSDYQTKMEINMKKTFDLKQQNDSTIHTNWLVGRATRFQNEVSTHKIKILYSIIKNMSFKAIGYKMG